MDEQPRSLTPIEILRKAGDRIRKRLSIHGHRRNKSSVGHVGYNHANYNPGEDDTFRITPLLDGPQYIPPPGQRFRDIVDLARAASRLSNTAAAIVPLDQELTVLSAASEVSLPMPTEVFHLILPELDLPSVLALGRALPPLLPVCWRQAFALTPITIRERELQTKRGKSNSNVELLKDLLHSTPEILKFMGGLDIKDQGRVLHTHLHSYDRLTKSSQSDLQALADILESSSEMKHLSVFKIQCSIPFLSLPPPLQSSFATLFESPNLQEVVLADIQLPVNFLSVITGLKRLEVQPAGVSGPTLRRWRDSQDEVPVAPNKYIRSLKFRDRNAFSDATPSILGFSTQNHQHTGTGPASPVSARTPSAKLARPFDLSRLKHLDVCLPGNRLSAIQPGLNICSRLEELRLEVGTAGGLPTAVSLQSLSRSLRSLTLSTDLTNILESGARFEWLCDTLSSLDIPESPPPPASNARGVSLGPSSTQHPKRDCRLQELQILVRIDTLLRSQDCPWHQLDELFAMPTPVQIRPSATPSPLPDPPFAQLSTISLIFCTSRKEDLREYLNEAFVSELSSLLPNVVARSHIPTGDDDESSTDVYGPSKRMTLDVRTTYSDAEYNFWTFS